MKEKMKRPEYAIRLLFGAFTLLALLAAVLTALLCGEGFSGMLNGLGALCIRSGQLTKSFFDAGYGGFSGTFLNVALVCAVCLGLYCLPGAKPDGVSVLAFFLTAGFSFWGITILSVWFSFAGVALYCLVKKKPLGSQANACLFTTGLAPLITELLTRYPSTDSAAAGALTLHGVLLALAVGLFIGFILPAGLAHSPQMHKGYDLYSAAVPIGLTAFFLRALLYKVLTPAPPESAGVGLGDSFPAVSFAFCGAVFALAIVCGLLLGGGKQYGALLRRIAAEGYGFVLAADEETTPQALDAANAELFAAARASARTALFAGGGISANETLSARLTDAGYSLWSADFAFSSGSRAELAQAYAHLDDGGAAALTLSSGTAQISLGDRSSSK